MTKDPYSIENLVETFAQHAIQYEIKEKQRADDFKKNYPEEPPPKYLGSDFNLSKALHEICKHIRRIRQIVGD